jgi:hypothetical protein
MIKEDYGVKAKPITVRNPQANAIVEQVHQDMGNIIRTFELENNYLDDNNPWKGILSATAFAVQSTFHTTLQNGQPVFGHDMILNMKPIGNISVSRNKILYSKIIKLKMLREYLTLTILVIKFYLKEEQKINMSHLIRVLLLSPK